VTWWKQKAGPLPIWAWPLLGLVALIMLGAIVGDPKKKDDAKPAPTTTEAQPTSTTEPPTTTTAPTTTTEAPTTTPAPTTTKAPTTTAAPEATPAGLKRSTAYTTCEQAGDKAFPYGYRRHITGTIFEAVQGDTWFMKYEATIKNEFNAKRTATVECTIGGSDAAPSLVKFDAY
jgi:hypothetical protein